MKDKKQKKNKGESVIGKIIYGFLLFLPLFAIGITCLVNVFNFDAKKEHTINNKYSTNEVNSNEDLIDGNIYHFEYKNIARDTFIGSNKIYYYDIFDILGTQTPYQYASSGDIPNITINYEAYMYHYTSKEGNLYKGIQSNYYQCEIVYKESLINSENLYILFSKSNYFVAESNPTNVNNVFYYAVEQVEESTLFNWSKNSIIYTGINATCNAISITNTFIPMLLTYWLIISVIYFLYDIILMCVLILHNKIHEMQDSI